MKKKKKRINQRINPEKSNKMIYAVGIGILILFTSLFLITTGGHDSNDPESIMKNTLSYLNNTEGIGDIEFFPESNLVRIICEIDPNTRSVIDYNKMAVFAGVKLSNKLKDKIIKVILIKKPEVDPVLKISVKNGKVLTEE